MTNYTKRIILILLFFISKVKLISSLTPYCEFDLCDETEYCCKRNVCCPKPNENVSIIVWILVGLVIIGIACGVLYKFKSWLYRFLSRGSESEVLTSHNNPHI